MNVTDFLKSTFDPSDPTGTVYGYVPIEVVESLVEKHGGMIE